MNASRITAQLLEFSLIFVGRLRGGLGLVNVFASMLFGGISGLSSSDTASIGSVLIHEMEKRGYPPAFASGITGASSTNVATMALITLFPKLVLWLPSALMGPAG